MTVEPTCVVTVWKGGKEESVYLLLYVIPLFNRRRIDVFAPPLFPCDWHSE